MPDAPFRPARLLAGATALTVATGSVLLFAVATPAAAASGPQAQAVGRFVDGQLGPQTLESAVDVKDARASNPGTVTDQNPLDITIGGQGDVPLSHKAQEPGQGNAAHFGAANQVAQAHSNGYAYGASGAVRNSGGASVGGKDTYPADATFDLSPKAVPSPGTLPLPGAGNLAALGGVTATVGAVSALASTPAGYTKPATTNYQVAGLSLTIGSPAFGGFLSQLGDALKLPPVPSLPGMPQACSFKTQALSTLQLNGGAVTINPTDGSLAVDMGVLLKQLGLDLNRLPANTDVLASLLDYLTSAKGLAAGAQAALHGIFDPLQENFATCMTAFTKNFPPPMDAAAQQAFTALTNGQTQIVDAINNGVDQLSAAGGSNPLAPLADGLKKLLDIGVNVQPNGAHGSFASALKATPDQATPVIAGQTVVRAIEINFLPAAGSSPAATLALGNAAAGPSTPLHIPHVVQRHHAPPPPDTRVPTGVPAGAGTHGGSPGLPILLIVLSGVLAATGVGARLLFAGRGIGRRAG